jgi:hypothetical protein
LSIKILGNLFPAIFRRFAVQHKKETSGISEKLYGVLVRHLVACGKLRMAKKNPSAERLGEVLDKSLQRLELSSQLGQYGIWPIWNDVVGTPIARNAQPEKIRNGTLFVKVTSPVWMQQLQFMKQMIADKVNERLRSEVVKNIFFVVGRIDTDIGEGEFKRPLPQKRELEDSRLDESFLESVTDPDIRQAFKRLLKGYARRKPKN